MAQHRLSAEQLAVGAPLPFDAYDSRGVLLLRRGSIIISQSQLDRLIENGLYSDDPQAQGRERRDKTVIHVPGPGERVSVVETLAAARDAVDAIFAIEDPTEFGARLTDLARAIRHATLLDPDAATGQIVTSAGTPYPARQAINTTVVAALLLNRLEATDADIESALCATLTMNLGMHALQATLYAQKETPDAAQREAIASHPARSVAMLRARGVVDDAWLAAVAQHHELLDGSGYPQGLSGDAVGRTARIMGIVDQYCALVSERAFREGINPGAALRHLLVTQGKGLDPALSALLLRELTPYPPGAAVRLINGETAIVCRRTRHPEQPVVRALIAPGGVAYPQPRKRVTSQSAYHVEKPVPQRELRTMPRAEVLWDDAFDPG